MRRQERVRRAGPQCVLLDRAQHHLVHVLEAE